MMGDTVIMWAFQRNGIFCDILRWKFDRLLQSLKQYSHPFYPVITTVP